MKEILIFASIFFLFVQPVLAQELYSLEFTPVEPRVFENVTISAGVKNTEADVKSYSLDLLVTQEGQIKQQKTFTFSLNTEEGKFFSISFLPEDLGSHEVIAKLSDVTGKDIGALIKQFNVVSEVGPFEIEITVPSKTVKPGDKLPLILSLENLGEKATDVLVTLELACETQTIKNQFFVFLWPGSITDKTASLDTCNEVGSHEVVASIVLFNTVWITATSEFFLNETSANILFEPPEVITAHIGESQIFDLSVKNIGVIPISNLKLIISGAGSEWTRVTPSSIRQIDPDKIVIFLVNFTIPKDVSPQRTKLDITAAADQTLVTKSTTLEAISLGAPIPVLPLPAPPPAPQPGFVFPTIPIPVIVTAMGIGGSFVFAYLVYRYGWYKFLLARIPVEKVKPRPKPLFVDRMKQMREWVRPRVHYEDRLRMLRAQIMAPRISKFG